jgi:hypothetical protein
VGLPREREYFKLLGIYLSALMHVNPFSRVGSGCIEIMHGISVCR